MFKHLLLLSFFFSSVVLGNCVQSIKDDISTLNNKIHQEYSLITEGKSGIKNFSQAKSNEAIFIEGDNKVLVLFHGFMASPREMLALGQHLYQTLGHSIYIPMIIGFGAVSEVNEAYNFEDWQRSLASNIALMERCYADIGVVGYSIGAGILTDHLLSESASKNIKSVVLLSPFFKGHAWQMPALGTALSKGMLNSVRYLFRVKKIKLTTVDKLTRGRYKDLRVLIDDPDTYTQSFSVKSGKALMDITKSLKRVASSKQSHLPTFLAYSKSDQTISWRFAQKFTSKHFSHIEDSLVIEKEENIPHEIVVPRLDLNPSFSELYDRISTFLRRNM